MARQTVKEIARTSPALKAVKAAHTIVWAVFAGCILAIPVASWRGQPRVARWLVAVVAGEVGVLVLNRWRCPLTSVAARHTDDRRDNFDIYLPAWLARHNTSYTHGRRVGSFVRTVRISRADVADFMLNQMTDNTYVSAAPGVCWSR